VLCSTPHITPRYGVMLGWTGSPEAPEPEAVGRYLERFLMDPMVIRAPWLLRALLVRGLIVPRRKYRSAEAYRRIWTPLGSPLAAHTAALAEALEVKLGLPVLHGSAYGSPTLEDAARKAASLGDVPWLFMPLFPQYAGATRGTLETRFLQAARNAGLRVLGIIPPFYDDPAYIDALTKTIFPSLETFQPDHLLFSFHGLPLSHVRRDAARGPGFDYVSQCGTTMDRLLEALNWPRERASLGWQSRLGRGWLAPDTAGELARLARRGVRRLAVIAPSFVADCLETLEELGITGRDTFLRHGGDAYLLCPALNTGSPWISAINNIIDKNLKFETLDKIPL